MSGPGMIDPSGLDGDETMAAEPAACSVERVDEALPAQQVSDSVLLADHTTFHIGGRARSLVVARTEQQLRDAVLDADRAGHQVLMLSGGSNVLISDADFEGTVVLVATGGISADVSDCGGALVTVAAGVVWDDFVAHAVANDWRGIEALSGIPGLVGSTPIQNVGAYGAEVASTIARVRTLDRTTGQQRTFFPADCQFSYRHSVFKANPGRYLILDVTFHFELATISAPIQYPELARALGVEVGQRAPMAEVREQVLAIRRAKAMVLDAGDHDTWSAGSFFTNPVLDPDVATTLPDGAPRFEHPGGGVKTSAAWLINHAGFERGYHLPGRPRAALSSKHVLALTNRGGASSDDIVALARAVRDGVRERFGVTLVAEPVLVGLEL